MRPDAATAERDGPGVIGRAIGALATGVALLGGLVLFALVGLTVASILGRTLFNAPVPGDFELVEIGCAVAVFAFLPYCQYTSGNVVVDFFTARAAPRTRALLELLGNLAYTGIAALLTWRLALGGLELQGYRETTMVLQVPVWWGFVPVVACSALLTVVCLYTAARSFGQLRTGAP